jgi:hypothetical protein
MFQLAYLYAQVKEGKIPDLFVQDPKYFEKYTEEIKAWFGADIGTLPYTAIHLRVGANPTNPDEPKYSENPFYVNLAKTGYYIKALEHFPHGKFIVFSDDIPFAKTYFEGDRFAFDESKTDLEAFNLASSCDGHIISNSSFSWWWAFLSPHANKKVICPIETSWFADKQIRTRVPKDWIQVDP